MLVKLRTNSFDASITCILVHVFTYTLSRTLIASLSDQGKCAKVTNPQALNLTRFHLIGRMSKGHCLRYKVSGHLL